MNHPEANPPGGAIVQYPPTNGRVPAVVPAAAPSHLLAYNLRGDNADAAEAGLPNYWQILIKRKWVVLSVLATVVMIVLLATMLTPPVYRATATLQIDLDTIKVIQTEGVTPGEGGGNRDYYQTQYELLRTRALAERVAAKLPDDLPAVRESLAPSAFARLVAAVRGRSAEPAQKLDRDQLIAFVQHNLRVEPVRNSRLVRVHFDSVQPALSATMANAITDAFITANIDRRFDASAYAKSYLEERLQQLKLKLEDSEKQLVAFAQQEGIVNGDEQQSPGAQEMQRINESLAAAQQQRIEAESKFRRTQQTAPEALPEVLLSAVISQLKNRRTELVTQYQEKLRIFKPDYPAMLQIQSQIDEMDQQLRSETGRIKQSIRSEYESALNTEALLAKRLSELKLQLLDLQGRSIKYNIIKREVDTNRQLYDGLLQRYKEIGVAGGIGANNISVVDRARAPRGRYSPSLSRNLSLGLLVGLAAGALLALLFERLDDTIKLPEDVERHFGLAVLGVIPRVARGSPLSELDNPRSAFSESYRSVRTALQFSTDAGVPKTLFITSSTPGEGKSTTALTLSLHFAQLGKRVLLIDADLRNPTLHHLLAVSNDAGLSNYLSGASRPLRHLRRTRVKNLASLCSGPLPPNPAELLAGPRMVNLLQLVEGSFDQIIIDGPPVLGIADAAILSNLSGGTILVVESGSTRRGYARGVLRRLISARARVLGVVLTKLDPRTQGPGYGDSYYSYDGATTKKLSGA
jgi:capsular exopolysaccharide synthesis family protein